MPRAAASRHARRRQPIQARSRVTVEAILEATARILVARGWAGTTTNHIAARAGVSIGTLYEYYPSKEALVDALVDRHLTQAEGALAAVTARFATGTPRLSTLVRAMVDVMLTLHAAAPPLHRVLFEEVPHRPAVRRRVRALEDMHAEALTAVLARVTRIAEPARVARVVVELLEALAHRWLVTAAGEPLPRDQMATELERLVLAYLRAAQRRPVQRRRAG